MVAEEQEPACIPGPPKIDDHDTVLRRLHVCLDVSAHKHGLMIRQVADEDRILDPGAVGLHAGRDVAQPTVLADVVGDQVTTAGHWATW